MKNYANCHIKNISMERKLKTINNEYFGGIYSHLSITRVPLFTIIAYGLNYCDDCLECEIRIKQLSFRGYHEAQ